MTDGRLLLLIRHSKADPDDDAGDHGRGLTARGRRDAAAIGRWLAENDLVPDLVLCSDARRARETWTAASSELADPPPVRDEAALYEASVERVLDLVAGTGDAVQKLAVVGHDPTTTRTAVALAGPGSEAAMVAEITAGLPTSGVAVLRVPGEWGDVAGGSAVLVQHASPRG